MIEKPTIVHVIDSLVRGGAETLLVNLLQELNLHYNVVLVTLTSGSDFDESKIVCYKRYSLNYTSVLSILPCALRLRSIIKKYHPFLVRSQLFISSVIARIATPKSIPLVFSIHNPMSMDSYKKNRLALLVEKFTYKKRHHLIGVSKDALQDFNQYVGIRGRSYTLYNFINQLYVDRAQVKNKIDVENLKLVAVGNLKEQKNYFYLIEAFKKLTDRNISLDIYGTGHLTIPLQNEIDTCNLKINLKGKSEDIYDVLQQYDLYVMCSLYEGFGIAPVEAMAIGLPLLLSDLPVLREVTHNNALFFKPDVVESFVFLIEEIMQGRYNLSNLSVQGIKIAKENYQQKDYFKKLNAIYKQVAANS